MQMDSAGKGFRVVWVLALSVVFTTLVRNVQARAQLPPTGKPTLYVDALSSTRMWVKWTDVEGETEYRIERSSPGKPWVEIAARGGNSADYFDEGLQPRTLYAYRVRAWNAAGFSEYSDEAAATTWVAPPSAPPGVPRIVSAQRYALSRDVSGVAIEISLEQSTGADGYQLEAKTGASGTWAQIADIAAVPNNYGISFTHTNLAISTDYYYRVRAYNLAGSSAYSAEAQARTYGPPTAAPEVAGIARSYNELELRWNDLVSCNCDAPGWLGYRLEVPNGAGWTNLVYLEDDVTNYVVKGLEPATEYSFRLRSENPLASDWSYVKVKTQDGPPVVPQAPVLYAEKESGHSIRVKWLDVELETEYRIERKNAAGQWEQIGSVPANTLFYVDAGLEPSTTYVYRIRAANSYGASAYSNESAGTTGPPPEIPILYGVRAAFNSQTPTAIELYWTEAEGAVLYRVERKSGDGAGGWQNIHETTTAPSFPGFMDTGLTEYNYYLYRVGAQNAAGTWFYSNERGARPHLPNMEQFAGVSATAVSSSSIKLSWPGLPFASAYSVIKLVNGKWVRIVDYTWELNYTDTGLSPATTYTYLVYAYRTGSSETPATISATTLSVDGGSVISMQSIALTADSVGFGVRGGAGQKLKIQSSSDFSSWVDVSEALTISGDTQVSIPRPAATEKAFYRTISVP